MQTTFCHFWSEAENRFFDTQFSPFKGTLLLVKLLSVFILSSVKTNKACCWRRLSRLCHRFHNWLRSTGCARICKKTWWRIKCSINWKLCSILPTSPVKGSGQKTAILHRRLLLQRDWIGNNSSYLSKPFEFYTLQQIHISLNEKHFDFPYLRFHVHLIVTGAVNGARNSASVMLSSGSTSSTIVHEPSPKIFA